MPLQPEISMWNLVYSTIIAGIALFAVFTAHNADVTSRKPLGASQTISSLPSHTNPDDADSIPIVDSVNGQTKRITWGNATSSLAAYFSPIFSTSAVLAGLLSDENGTGNFALSSSTALTSPRLTSPSITLGSDATGDMYYRNSSGAFTRLPIGPGTSYYLRTSASGIPEWNNNVLSSIVTASTTFNATTSIAADSVSGRAFILNGIPYQFPSQLFTSTSSGMVLVASSTGVLSWGSPLASAISSYSTSSTGFSSSYTGSTTIRHNLGVRPRTVRIKTIGWSSNTYSVQSSSDSIISRTNNGTSTTAGVSLCTTPHVSSMASSVMTGGLLSVNVLGVVYSSGSNSIGCDDGEVYKVRFRAIDETTMTIAEDVISGTGGVVSNASMIFEFIP